MVQRRQHRSARAADAKMAPPDSSSLRPHRYHHSSPRRATKVVAPPPEDRRRADSPLVRAETTGRRGAGGLGPVAQRHSARSPPASASVFLARSPIAAALPRSKRAASRARAEKSRARGMLG